MFKILTRECSMKAEASQTVGKRLQRARKFVPLVQKFGTVVLNAVPQVSPLLPTLGSVCQAVNVEFAPRSTYLKSE